MSRSVERPTDPDDLLEALLPAHHQDHLDGVGSRGERTVVEIVQPGQVRLAVDH
ncbi:MAG: hypothetical protein ABW026_16895 [Microvirga sp.]